MSIESAYRARVDAMSTVERVRRAEALFAWAGDYLRRSILAERGPLSQEQLKWEVALRRYGADPRTRALIEALRARAAG
jgi:hypothetical protein